MKNAQVIVRAPDFVKIAYIDNLVALKSQWLSKKLAQQQSSSDLSSSNKNNSFHPENLLNINGVLHKVIIYFGRPKVLHDEMKKLLFVFIPAKFSHYNINSTLIITKVKLAIEQWFKVSVADYLNYKLPLFSEKTLLHATSFKVRKYKARWGSCNSRGELSFNCLLKMLPPWVVDYVIVHELCHLKYMNHSTKFWLLVEKHYPDFISAKKWLKENQQSLTWS